ncbi:MAG: hypothetical protein PHU71_03360 [Candidatus Gracilibacteria bacterium]|nr:hypothetical protein [Candidatus Gracilibacteria bacterium]
MFNSLFDKLLQEDEQIEYIIHKHWISLIYPLLKSILLGLFAPALMIWLYSNDLKLVGIGLIWLVLGMIWCIYNFLDWHYDALLITDQHLIEIEWDSFFKRNTNRIRYENIDNVSYLSHGIWSSMLGFADLKIVTYAREEKLLKNACNAKEFQNLLMSRTTKEDTTEKSAISNEHLKQALKSILQEELAEEEQLVEASSEEKEQEIVVLEQKSIRPRKKL